MSDKLSSTREEIAVPVKVRDIIPWTKPGCKTCDGRGVFTKIQMPSKQRQTVLCECAKTRFVKRSGQDTYVYQGRLYAIAPWVAVHPETIGEAIKATEDEQEKKDARRP